MVTASRRWCMCLAIPRKVAEEHTAYLTTEISNLSCASALLSFGETSTASSNTGWPSSESAFDNFSLLFTDGNQTLGLCQNKRLSPPLLSLSIIFWYFTFNHNLPYFTSVLSGETQQPWLMLTLNLNKIITLIEELASTAKQTLVPAT